jgi:hypothetical protein
MVLAWPVAEQKGRRNLNSCREFHILSAVKSTDTVRRKVGERQKSVPVFGDQHSKEKTVWEKVIGERGEVKFFRAHSGSPGPGPKRSGR